MTACRRCPARQSGRRSVCSRERNRFDDCGPYTRRAVLPRHARRHGATVPTIITEYAKKCRAERCRHCVRSARNCPQTPTSTDSHQWRLARGGETKRQVQSVGGRALGFTILRIVASRSLDALRGFRAPDRPRRRHQSCLRSSHHGTLVLVSAMKFARLSDFCWFNPEKSSNPHFAYGTSFV